MAKKKNSKEKQPSTASKKADKPDKKPAKKKAGSVRKKAETKSREKAFERPTSGPWVLRGTANRETEIILSRQEVVKEFADRSEELKDEYETAVKTLKKYRRKLLSKNCEKRYGQITGMCVQLRTKYGQIVSPLRFVICIYVNRKLTATELQSMGLKDLQEFDEDIPGKLDRVPIKVLESRAEQAFNQASATSGNHNPTDPLPLTDDLVGGVPIASKSEDGWGTLGVCLPVGPNFIGLTNAHVLSTPNAVEQLGPSDSQPTRVDIGNKQQAIRGTPGAWTVDCASIALSSVGRLISVDVRGWQAAWSLPILYPKDGKRVGGGDYLANVYLFGAKSGVLKKGELRVAEMQFLDIDGFRAYGVMQIKSDSGSFALRGDSGSLLLMEATANGTQSVIAIGLVIAQDASDSTLAYACHMNDVLKNLHISRSSLKTVSNWTPIRN